MKVIFRNSHCNHSHNHVVSLDLAHTEFEYPEDGVASAGWLDLVDGPKGYPLDCRIHVNETTIEGKVLVLEDQRVLLGFENPAAMLVARLTAHVTGALVGTCDIKVIEPPAHPDQNGLEPTLA